MTRSSFEGSAGPGMTLAAAAQPVEPSGAIWSIGVYTGPSPLELSSPAPISNPVLTADDVTDLPAAFVADPFLVREAGRWHLFFEIMPVGSRVGVIGLAESRGGLRWHYCQVVLREPFHLSYPHVFRWHGSYYMTPETLAPGCIRLYRARRFPDRWEPIADLVEGHHADLSVVRFGGVLVDLLLHPAGETRDPPSLPRRLLDRPLDGAPAEPAHRAQPAHRPAGGPGRRGGWETPPLHPRLLPALRPAGLGVPDHDLDAGGLPGRAGWARPGPRPRTEGMEPRRHAPRRRPALDPRRVDRRPSQLPVLPGRLRLLQGSRPGAGVPEVCRLFGYGDHPRPEADRGLPRGPGSGRDGPPPRRDR